MTINNFISDNIPYARLTDTIGYILQIMDEEKIECLPVVENDILVGWLRESMLLDIDENRKIDSLPINDDIPLVKNTQTLTEVLVAMQTYNIPLVPIVDKSDKYLGCITTQNIVEAISILIGAKSNGATIAFQINAIDYSLTRIVNIIEENGAHIYSITTNSETQSDYIEVFVRLNIDNAEAILDSLERYGYHAWILGLQQSDDSILVRNYNSLMQYLNIDN